MKAAIIEVGSTTTKMYLYDQEKLVDSNHKYIPFKSNYRLHGKLLDEDIKSLIDFVKEFGSGIIFHMVGTSIFRNVTNKELEAFKLHIKDELGIEFRVVSALEECDYTVKGVIDNIDYDQKLAVVIGGGGSTELAIIDNKQIINTYKFSFGAMDITDKFPELKCDIVPISFDKILAYTNSLLEDIEESVDTLVLAGGDYLYFYENADYPLDENELYHDVNQPSLLSFDKMDKYDHDILNKSLEQLKHQDQRMASWWDGARGMRFCMNAVARKLNAKNIIPTKINMLIGLANEILKKNH